MVAQARPPVSTRAIVVGASIAGLVAARVLADDLDEVVLVERDPLPDGAQARPGVPQAAHVHILLRRGYVELRRLFPMLDARLAAAGATPIDWGRDAMWVTRDGTAPRFRSGLRSRAASRALLEATLRTLTLEHPNIRLVDGTEAVGLIGDAGGIVGVRLRRRPGAGDAPRAGDPSGTGGPSGGGDPSRAEEAPGAGDVLRDDEAQEPRPADDPAATIELRGSLVVDAAGRSSRLPAELAALGLPVPDETVIDAALRYATRTYRVPPGTRDWMAVLVRDRPPTGTRGGGVFPIEGDRWVVTLGAAGGDRPPTDAAGYAAFVESLFSPLIADAIRDAEPLTPVRGWARTANRWRHVERIHDWPPGLALVGDALCALNPVYGQGMSVAAMEGPVLARWLRGRSTRRALAAGAPPPTAGLLRDLARTARLPWFLATAEDVRIESVIGAPPPGRFESIARRYVDELFAVAIRDQRTMLRFIEVNQLVRPPIALLDPPVAGRVVGSILRGIRRT
jgi:2-polyprenyl-6-methoxyphenol hydroxylase-like FAD-dependent oxidoreductase